MSQFSTLLPIDLIGARITGQTPGVVSYYVKLDEEQLKTQQVHQAMVLREQAYRSEFESLGNRDHPAAKRYIHADDVNSNFARSLRQDLPETLVSYGCISITMNNGTTRGLDVLRETRAAHAAENKTEICPYGNHCPPEIIEQWRGLRRCGLCQYAVRSIDHLPAVSATFGTLDVTECVLTLKQRVDTTHGGDLKHAETTLTAQAATLDAIFNEMARRAALNMGEYLDATERYMRLALKAQGQCRATLETLAAIKNPPVIFAKQANIAHGPQQVNNEGFETNTHARARARKPRTAPDELLEGPQHGSTNMDDRAATTTARGHPTVEALEPIHRPRKPRRKGGGSA